MYRCHCRLVVPLVGPALLTLGTNGRRGVFLLTSTPILSRPSKLASSFSIVRQCDCDSPPHPHSVDQKLPTTPTTPTTLFENAITSADIL